MHLTIVSIRSSCLIGRFQGKLSPRLLVRDPKDGERGETVIGAHLCTGNGTGHVSQSGSSLPTTCNNLPTAGRKTLPIARCIGIPRISKQIVFKREWCHVDNGGWNAITNGPFGRRSRVLV